MTTEEVKEWLAMPPEERYEYFIYQSVLAGQVWVIKEGDSVATLGDSGGKTFIPAFPAEVFVQSFLIDEWKECTAEAIGIEEFIDMLDVLDEDGIEIAGFPNEQFHVVIIPAKEVKQHILDEMNEEQAN